MTQIIGEAEKENSTILFQMFKKLEGRGKVKVWIMVMQKKKQQDGASLSKRPLSPKGRVY